MQCRFDGCRNAARKAGLCYGHHWQWRFVGVLTPLRLYGLPPLKRLEESSVRLQDASAEDDVEYRRARDLFRKHAKAYGLSLLARKPCRPAENLHPGPEHTP